MSNHRIECTVNGEACSVEHVPARRLLSDFLRDDLLLTGTKRGCETGICGACSVLVDGEVVKSCLMLAVQVQGREIRTVEGLADGDRLHPLQESFMQCGGLVIMAWPGTRGGQGPPRASHIPSRPLLTRTFTATRRFCALPSTVSLLAAGSASAIPVGVSMR